ncbi:MAG: arylsulfatase, partial [Rikenellaceae bacterium]
MKLNPRSIAVATACSAALLPSVIMAQNTKPNIIFILADDMGYGDVAALDPNSKIETPHLDQMVRDGMAFTDAHTTSSVSSPSRYALVTGRYNWRSPMQSGVLWSFSAPLIERERPTVATILSENGYNTAVIGKWHLGLGWERFGEGENDVLYTKVDFSPIDNGFDYSFIMSASLDIPPYTFIEGHNFTAPVNDTIAVQNGYGFYREGAIAEDFDINTALERFTSESLKYIDQKSKEDNPYFLYFPLTAPHTPILPPEEFQGKSGINPYADFVMYVDDIVGRIIEGVRASGEEQNTLIIFSTDNGCSPSANFAVTSEAGHSPNSIYRGMKADIYDGGHRVPFIVKWPEKVEAGSQCDKTISLASFMATCADINDIEIPEGA